MRAISEPPIEEGIRKKEEKEEYRRVVSSELLSFFNLWNELSKPPMAKVNTSMLKPSSQRVRSAKERLKEIPDLNYWRGVIEHVVASDFCKGQNDRGWVADVDFLLRPDTHLKVMEGKYGLKKKDPYYLIREREARENALKRV